MKRTFRLSMMLFSALTLAVLSTSCKKDKDGEPDEPEVISAESTHSILGSVDGAYYLAQSKELMEGSVSFINNGTQLDADQAARVVASGDYLYSLNYGTGLLTQLQPNEEGGFNTVKEINAGLAVGTNRPRYKVADENTIMVYNVVVTPIKNAGDTIIDNTCTLRLVSISIPSLTINNLTEFNIPQSANAKLGGRIGYHPMRVDAPVIAGDKIYFGIMHTDVSDPTVPPPFRKPKQTGLETLVFDYPSFSNGHLTLSSKAAGHTGGYRAPSMHVDESGDVYQSNWFMSGNSFDLSGGDKTVITRLRNGAYDESYEFNVSTALGLSSNVATVGWFYVGNGIGYMPIQLEDEGGYYQENTWSVAKIDIYNKTAVKLDVPLSSLFEYENGIVSNGKFYMAISPIGGEAYIYEFDPNSTGFTKGLKLDGANIIVEGIY